MFKHFIIVTFLIGMLEASTDIVDSVEILEVHDRGTNINIIFDIKTHRGVSNKKYIRKDNKHKCFLFDTNGHMIARSKGKAIATYIYLHRNARQSISSASIVCSSKVNGKVYKNRMRVELK